MTSTAHSSSAPSGAADGFPLEMPVSFTSVTVILPVVTETRALEKTVSILLRESRSDICELLTVVCDRTTDESMACIQKLSGNHPELMVVHH